MVAVRLSGCSEIDSHGCCEIERLGAQAVLEILEDYFSLDKETALEALQVYRRFDEQTNQQVPPTQQVVAEQWWEVQQVAAGQIELRGEQETI